MGVRVSLKQVAQAAGISISAVSQALREDGRISLKTREKVKKIAQQLGYRRDPLISQFASRKFHHDSHLAGTTLLFLTASSNPNPVGGSMYASPFKQRAEKLGFRFEHIELPLQFDYARLQKQWFYRGVRGLAFGPVFRCPLIIEEAAPDFAVVCLGGHIRTLTYHTVKSEVSTAVMGVWKQACQRGYKRIGFAINRHSIEILDDKLRLGMAYSLSTSVKSPIPIYSGTLNDSKSFLAWFKKYRPDAVIGFPLGLRYWMEETGVRVPEDCAFLATSATPTQDNLSSGWIEDDEAIAFRAADLLDTMIRHGDAGFPSPPTITLVEGTWKEGNTAPPVRGGTLQPLNIVR